MTNKLLILLIGALSLVAGATNLDKAESSEAQSNAADCGVCNDMYMTCMMGCLGKPPYVLGKHAECNQQCFCSVTDKKYYDCGVVCGYETGCPNTKNRTGDSRAIDAISAQDQKKPALEARSDAELTVSVQDCGYCNDLYLTCMDACMKSNPSAPHKFKNCNDACFCAVARREYSQCGMTCGYLVGCPDANKPAVDTPAGNYDIQLDKLLDPAVVTSSDLVGEMTLPATMPPQNSRPNTFTTIIKSQDGLSGPTSSPLNALAARQESPPCRDCAHIVDNCYAQWCPQKRLLEAVLCVCGTVAPGGCEQSCWAGQGGCLSGAAASFSNCGRLFGPTVPQIIPRQNPTTVITPLVTITVERCKQCNYK